MDTGKLRGAKGKADKSNPSSSEGGELTKKGANPKNITETKVFKQGMGGLGAMWSNYRAILATYFKRMPRGDQEALIVRLCQVVTVGCAIVLTSFFYQWVPLLVRVFALPAFIVGSWFVATRVVSPIIIAQFESKLNRSDF